MEFYCVTFAGHRDVGDYKETEQKLEQIISSLLKRKDYVEFYVSDDGDFNIIATAVIRRLREKLGEHSSSLNLVLPYTRSNMDLMTLQFDSLIIPEELSCIHYKRAISERNKWMIDHSELIIAYVKKNNGGAFDMLKYAEKKGVEIIHC